MSSPQRFPLAWPAHRPRRKAQDRIRGEFIAGGKLINATAASDKLEDQIERLGGKYPILSSNIELRMDGRPKSGLKPVDPGVCAYFELKGRPLALACDTYTEVAQNIAAIANHIEAVRRQERYGVASAEESLQAFVAIEDRSSWRDVLGLRGPVGRSDIESAHRRLAADHHPDKGGDPARMADINAARDAALKEIQS